jgi:signal transduction histidine kinase
VLYAAPPPATTVLGVAAVAVMLALQLGVTGRRAGWAGPRRAALVVQALLAAGSIVLVGDPSVGLPGFVAGSALLVLPPRLRWVAFAGTVAAVTAAQAGLVGTPDGIAYGIAATVNHGLVVYGLTRLRDLVDALQAARDDVAALAVARERLRFARDLHDLLGYGLSAIALKAELAGRLLVEDAERARHEIDDVLRIVADALDDARSVAGYQQSLDLAAEIDSVRSVLDAAGVRLRLTFDPPPGPSAIPAVPGTVLATVLREAVTNLLRHSDARHCTVALRTAGDALRLEVVNDGVRPGPPRAPGTGLGSLAARAESLGGALVAGRDGAGGFVVRVTVPATGGGPAADRFATQWEPVPVTAAR